MNTRVELIVALIYDNSETMYEILFHGSYDRDHVM